MYRYDSDLVFRNIRSYFTGTTGAQILVMTTTQWQHEPGYQPGDDPTQAAVFDKKGKSLFRFKERHHKRFLWFTLKETRVPTLYHQFEALTQKTRDKAFFVAIRKGLTVTIYDIQPDLLRSM